MLHRALKTRLRSGVFERQLQGHRYNEEVSRDARRAATGSVGRRSWPVHVHRLGAEPGDDLSATTTAEERLAMMWPLAVEAFALSGCPLPGYRRTEAPVTVRRLRS